MIDNVWYITCDQYSHVDSVLVSPCELTPTKHVTRLCYLYYTCNSLSSNLLYLAEICALMHSVMASY